MSNLSDDQQLITSPELNLLERLQHWYTSMCNGDWEHTYGISISNIDNPGWYLKIDLQDTDLQDAPFAHIKKQNSDEDDWLDCKVNDGAFQGYGGPNNLTELIKIFLKWAEESMPE